MTTHEERVLRGREALKDETNARWTLGDLALEEAPIGVVGHDDPTLELYAVDIGMDYGTLRNYRRIANAWPNERRRSFVGFSVHYELAGVEDRFELLDRLVAEHDPEHKGKLTVDIARRARGNKPTRQKSRKGIPPYIIATHDSYLLTRQAADIRQADDELFDDGGYSWSWIKRMRYELDRVEERLARKEDYVIDIDAEWAELLGGKA